MKAIEMLVEFADIANFFLLIFVLLSLWQNRVLQKKQFRFEKSKLFIEEKKEMYLKFLDFIPRDAEDRKKKVAERPKFLDIFTDEVRMYGDADVIDTWNRYVREMSSAESKPHDTQKKIIFCETERFLRALRKNMGHDDSELRPGSVMVARIAQAIQDKHKIIAPVQDEIFDACKGEKYKWLNDD